MSLIRTNILKIQEIYDKQSWSSPLDNSQKTNNTQQLEELLESTNLSSSQIRNRLKTLKEQNDALPAENAQKRIRSNMHAVLSKKFLVLLQEYQSIQNSYKEKSRERFHRQAEIVQPGVSREQVDSMLESSGGNMDYFGDKLLSDKKHGEAKNALMAIQEQQRDLKHLEKNIQELHQIFLDMSLLVESSTETMVKVQLDISDTTLIGENAIKHLKKAEEHVMQKRRKMAILASGIGAVVLIAILIVVIVLAVKAGKIAALT